MVCGLDFADAPPLPPLTALLFGNNFDSRGSNAYYSLSAVATPSTKDLVDGSMARQLSATILRISLKDMTAMVAEIEVEGRRVGCVGRREKVMDVGCEKSEKRTLYAAFSPPFLP